MFEISNDTISVSIATKGAELQSIINKETSLEYMWDANPAFWSKTSPVLFPIVGSLKNNTYTHKGNGYALSRHGFARESEFVVTAQTNTSITFTLQSNETTLKVYPFKFLFAVTYTIDANKLSCTYTIENAGAETMYCSVGAHPAFKIPLADDTNFDDWFLEFNQVENAGIYPLSVDGLIEAEPIPFINNTNQLPLNKALFYKDALVFKALQSKEISIRSNKSKHGLTMQFDGFPYYGIWSFKDADFVCLEPWCGIADGVNTTGELSEKEGIRALKANEVLEKVWSVSLF